LIRTGRFAFLVLPLALAGCGGLARTQTEAGPPKHYADPRAIYLFLYAWDSERSGEMEQAAAAYQEAARYDPSSAVLQAHLGHALVSSGKLAEAQAPLREAVRLDPAYADAHKFLAILALAENDTKGAATEIAEMQRLSPEGPVSGLDPLKEAQLAQVSQHVAAHNWKAAVAAQESLLQLMPGDSDAEKTLALLCRQSGDTQRAAALLEKLLRARPDDAEARGWLAGIYLDRSRPDDAIPHLRALWAANPKSVKAAWDLASAQAKGGHYPEAHATVATALTGVSGDDASLLWTLKGMLLLEEKRPADAVEALSKGVALQPHNEVAQFQLGVALDKTGDTAAAARAFYRTLDLDPKHAQAANYLGYSLADRNENLPEAERLIRLALAEEPDNGAYLDSLGWALYREGKLAEARTVLERGLERMKADGSPGAVDPVVLQHLNEVNRKLGLGEPETIHSRP